MTKYKYGIVKPNKEALTKLETFADDQPVFMLNYLKYKEVISATGRTGAETYADYLRAAAPFFEHIDAEIIFKGQPVATILGPAEEELWDEVLIVRYATKYEFFKLTQAKDYPQELRASALSDSRLIFCK